MAIFYSPNRIQFGAPLAAPAAHRPAEAGFVHGTVPRGYPFCLTWTYESGAVGYHVFRSQSISQIRPQMMLNFWRGSYGEGVTHFVIGEPTDTVIDNYRLRDATQMFYWVLSQDAAGHLRPVKNLQVRMADDFASARQHILLEPGRRNATAPIQAPEPPTQPVPRASTQQPSFEPMVPTVSDDDPFLAPSRPSRPNPRPQPQAPPAQRPAPRPATRPAPQPAQSLRQVFFVTYTAPAIFQIQPPGPVANYAIYIGTQIPPTPQMADAMWDGVLQPGHPMRRYTLPGQVQGFSDRHHPPGQQAYLAIFATLPDGTIIQPELVIPPTPPAAMADLT